MSAVFDRKRRKAAKEATADAVAALSPYAESLVHDPKLRRRLLAAAAAAAAARARVRRETGLSGLALRLATDQVLRGQLIELAAQLRLARERVDHRRNRRRRVLLIAGGAAAAATLAAVPVLRSFRDPGPTA